MDRITANQLAEMVKTGHLNRKEACRAAGIAYSTVCSRLQIGMSLEDALSFKATHSGRRKQWNDVGEPDLYDHIPNPSHPDGDLAHLSIRRTPEKEKRAHSFMAGTWEKQFLNPSRVPDMSRDSAVRPVSINLP